MDEGMEEKKREERPYKEQGLTKDLLRTYKGFENVTDEEAEIIISTLRKFSLLTYKCFRYAKETNKTDNSE